MQAMRAALSKFGQVTLMICLFWPFLMWWCWWWTACDNGQLVVDELVSISSDVAKLWHYWTKLRTPQCSKYTRKYANGIPIMAGILTQSYYNDSNKQKSK